MQIETFKVFCDLADSGSFSKAATVNGITQSAVSQQIRALEQRYDTMLIERGQRNFALTPEGEAFLVASREIVNIFANLGNRLRELSDVVTGPLKVATIYSIGLHDLPPYLKAFRAANPEVEISVEYRRSWEIYPLVLNGEVDLGLVSYPAKRKGIQIAPFLNDRLVLICHPGHALAHRKSLELREIEGEKFIAFGPDLPTRKVIDRYLRQENVPIKVAIEFDNIETVKRAVEVENGISIVPAGTVKLEQEKRSLAVVEIAQPEMWRPLGILLKRNRTRSPALKEFVALLQGKRMPEESNGSSGGRRMGNGKGHGKS